MTTLISVEAIWTPDSQQKIFRALLTALSFPGRVQDIAAPLGGGRSELGILAALVDEQVTLADPDDLLATGDRRLLAPAAMVDVSVAEYVVGDGLRPPAEGLQPNIGTIYRPEDGATVVIRVGNFGPPAPTGGGEESVSPPVYGGGGGYAVTLTGPGVETEQTFLVSGLHPEWLTARNRWCERFPKGCDLVLCAETQIVGIPRTSKMTFTELTEEVH